MARKPNLYVYIGVARFNEIHSLKVRYAHCADGANCRPPFGIQCGCLLVRAIDGSCLDVAQLSDSHLSLSC